MKIEYKELNGGRSTIPARLNELGEFGWKVCGSPNIHEDGSWNILAYREVTP